MSKNLNDYLTRLLELSTAGHVNGNIPPRLAECLFETLNTTIEHGEESERAAVEATTYGTVIEACDT